MKKQNGMSHITLVICIVIIIGLVVIGANFLKNETEDRITENLITDMLLIQGKVRMISEENAMNKEENPLKGIKIADDLEDERVLAIFEKGIVNQEDEELENYYILDDEVLAEVNLSKELKDEFYIVNYNTCEIYFSEGIKIEKEMYYSLTELQEYQKQQEEKEENKKQNKKKNNSANEEENINVITDQEEIVEENVE